ncbi:C69 family dipeptidase [Companilactobacillus sp.]|jgi:dipeptidase|uniref:C69 family dipeptidase n=1 Tax=Companilactobacillus sp. TaxID=2767905 RepID=UPI0025BE2926|nr:C69 family dipeptidase [Companilactobacillus sp.]MCH4008685.1 C69 family dipeptidase [Companilactobacillus sp.]MCH4051136.1 C69 family dipeptidase [Companilactobacillus sp.]MCH4076628.1 C69 family dipeptidase [Companilactobacillus sp.]MCH4125203.1 C69 family dipeptidase [Companilactobacillus sp.]MCH4131743.1 C69 family dipeptidase [Companilactobacillus sp.]
MKKRTSDCTEILVGKAASMDGSTIVARNEDGYGPINPLKFIVHEAKDQENASFTSVSTGVNVPLPDHAYRYTATPQADQSDGMWEESGINEYNVGMSATETTATNKRVLGYDPLVHDGVDEEAMVTLVLPYVKTAKEGVQRLGALLEKYGTGECNSIAFNDKNDVWLLETAGGHHWAAMRLPEDAYAIVPNQTVVQEIDPADTENFLVATDLVEFVEKHNLNPQPGNFNFRDIFGTHGEDDAYYNTPRTWYGQKLFNPGVVQDPTSQDMPMYRIPDKKLAIEDVQKFLQSHYNGTKFDPFGTFASGTPEEQRRFRPIAMDRNQCSSILQIRNGVDDNLAGVQWIAMGFFAYSPYVPFFTNITDTPEDYKNTTHAVSVDNVYWLEKTLSVLIEPHYHEFSDEVHAYLDGCQSYARQRVDETDEGLASAKDIPEYLTENNAKTAGEISKRTHQLFDALVKHGLNLSITTWEKGQNL